MDSLDWSRIIPAWVFPVWATLLGLTLGSFANVCIHRMPEHRSIVWPRSACPRCGHRIRGWHNIPLLSWIMLRGRCADCDTGIPIRYPLVELLTGLLFLALAQRFGPSIGFAVTAFFGLAMIILFFTDLETMLLPDVVTLPGIVTGLVLAPWNPMLSARGYLSVRESFVEALLGASLGAGLVIVIMVAWKIWVRGRLGPDASEEERTGMGQGDLKMLAMIGAFVGLRQVFFVTFLAAVLGSLVGVGMMLLGRGSRRTALPFGTFLALAAIGALFLGHAAVGWYMLLLGFR